MSLKFGLKTENLRTFETLGVERLSLLKTIAYRDARDVGWQRLKVVEGGGGVPHDEVDGDEEAAQDDAEGVGHVNLPVGHGLLDLQKGESFIELRGSIFS